MARLKLTVVFEYDTVDFDYVQENGTIPNPEEMAKLDQDSFLEQSSVLFGTYFTKDEFQYVRVEVVN